MASDSNCTGPDAPFSPASNQVGRPAGTYTTDASRPEGGSSASFRSGMSLSLAVALMPFYKFVELNHDGTVHLIGLSILGDIYSCFSLAGEYPIRVRCI